MQKLVDVMFSVFFDAKERRRHVKKVEDCDCLANERTHDALSRQGSQKEKLK